MYKALFVSVLFISSMCEAGKVSQLATETAQYAVDTYEDSIIESLSQLIKYNTVAVEGVDSVNNHIHKAFKLELSKQAKELGFDYQDHGYVVIIGFGESKERLGVITHGDVKPADVSKWYKSPYELDLTSEPGKLIGRGVEDDKGPISIALYAMKAIKDKKINLKKRIELYIYMAEESDWQPLIEFVESHELPQMSITLDSQYPVVTAEKGYGKLSVTFPNKTVNLNKIYIRDFIGGEFGGQIPEDARVEIVNIDEKTLVSIKAKAKRHSKVKFKFILQDNILTITAKGRTAHSSVPSNGINAITHLAKILSGVKWPSTGSGSLVNFINELVGINLYGEKFGNIAYSDEFMGRMTFSATHIKNRHKGIELNFNIRRPQGKTSQQFVHEIEQTIAEWQIKNKIMLVNVKHDIGAPWVNKNPPQLETLLTVFEHYTKNKDPKPVSFGGGTVPPQ